METRLDERTILIGSGDPSVPCKATRVGQQTHHGGAERRSCSSVEG